MSVESQYYAMPWDRVVSLSEESNPSEAIFAALEEEAPWLKPLRFGGEIDSYYFESWKALTELSDWTGEAASHLTGPATTEWRAIFEDVGLIWRGDSSAFDPVCELLTRDEWLLGSIPPDTVRHLHERAEALDLDALESEFDAALAAVPCELLPTGKEWANWVRALRVGLETAAEHEVGVVIGAA